jgi:hypothetical protein
MSGATSVWQPVCEGWRREEPGWWVMDGVGGICREADGRWWFYPVEDSERVGPFRTLSYAIARVRVKVLSTLSNRALVDVTVNVNEPATLAQPATPSNAAVKTPAPAAAHTGGDEP